MKKLFRATNFAMSILSFGFLVLNSLLCTPSLCSENRLSYVDNGEQLDFYLQDGNFSIMKDGVTYKQIPLNKDYKFMSSNTPSLSLNAIVIPAAIAAGAVVLTGSAASAISGLGAVATTIGATAGSASAAGAAATATAAAATSVATAATAATATSVATAGVVSAEAVTAAAIGATGAVSGITASGTAALGLAAFTAVVGVSLA